MARQQQEPKDYPRQEAQAAQGRFAPMRIVGAAVPALLVAALVGLNINWRNDGIDHELILGAVKAIDELKVEINYIRNVKLSDRYTGSQAREDWKTETARHIELERRFDKLEQGLSDLRVKVASGHRQP